MKINLFFILIFFCYPVYSYEEIQRYLLEGKIASNNITMVVEENKSEIHGGYIYNKYNKKILLKGVLIDDILKLDEFNNDKKTGSIEAVRDVGKDRYDGVWEGNKKHSFYVERKTKTISSIIRDYNIKQDDNPKSPINSISIDITFIDGTKQILDVDIINDDFTIYFEDLNFDGYPDIRVLENKGDVNASYKYFIYDKEKNKFRYSKILSLNVINPMVYYSEKLIYGFMRDGCCNYKITIVDKDKIKKASFNYNEGSGEVNIIGNDGSVIKNDKINKNNFESNYLNLMKEKL